MKKEVWVDGLNITFLSGKDQLAYLSKLAVERFKNNQSFTDEEVIGYFGAVEKVLSKAHVAALFKLAKDIHGRYNKQITFNMAVVEAIYSTLKLGGMPNESGEASP